MDTTPGAKAAHDPTSLFVSWHSSYVTYSSNALAEDTVLAAGESITLHLYREPARTAWYETSVTLTFDDGTGPHPLVDETVRAHVTSALYKDGVGAERQAGWHVFTFTLDEDVTIPAGARLDLVYQTFYEHPVDDFPENPRFNPTALPRPDIVNKHDSEDAPARLALTLREA